MSILSLDWKWKRTFPDLNKFRLRFAPLPGIPSRHRRGAVASSLATRDTSQTASSWPANYPTTPTVRLFSGYSAAAGFGHIFGTVASGLLSTTSGPENRHQHGLYSASQPHSGEFQSVWAAAGRNGDLRRVTADKTSLSTAVTWPTPSDARLLLFQRLTLAWKCPLLSSVQNIHANWRAYEDNYYGQYYRRCRAMK